MMPEREGQESSGIGQDLAECFRPLGLKIVFKHDTSSTTGEL